MDLPPVWLLDVDGVVNAATPEPPDYAWPGEQWLRVKARSHGREWPILAALPVLDFIRRVHEQGRAEIRWHTTWQDDALALADQLGLPEFSVQEAPEIHDRTWLLGPVWWKLPAAERVLRDEGRRLLWTDDDADSELKPLERAGLQALGEVLIVAPDSMTGLCQRHLREIDEFLPAAVEVRS